MRLYDFVVGQFRTTHGFFDFVRSTIRVKEGCSLSWTFFGIYIDEFEEFLRANTYVDDGCTLYHVFIAILIFTDVVRLALLTPRFSPLKILRVKSQHAAFWLAY
jgi:hypothetical protein